MTFRKKIPSCKEVKEVDLVMYLAKLGHHFVKVTRNDYWYFSPLRNEKTPSFKVNRKMNRWFDHGSACGAVKNGSDTRA